MTKLSLNAAMPPTRPIAPGVREYLMDRFIAAHDYLDHTITQAIDVVGGADERRSYQNATPDVKIKRLRQLMLDRGIIGEMDQSCALLLEECLRVDDRSKRVHKSYYKDADGALVSGFEDAIFGMRKAASDLNAAIVRRFPAHVPDNDRPSTTLDEGKSTGRYVLRRIKDLCCEGDQGLLTELITQYFFPDRIQPADLSQHS